MKKYGTGLGAGWHLESERHSLASKGIKTGSLKSPVDYAKKSSSNVSAWKKKWETVNNWTGHYWENEDDGSKIRIESQQDRDGKNAFVHSAIHTIITLTAFGPKWKNKVIAKGRDESLVIEKALKFMKVNGGSQ